jgi:hypothetical protein
MIRRMFFTVALKDYLSSADKTYTSFTPHSMNTITYTLWDLVFQVGQSMSSKTRLTPSPGWSYQASDLEPWDVVVYFVRDRSQSIAARLGAQPSDDAAGLTSFTSSGVVSEVYVEGNGPADKLALIAFHEIMHNKLQRGNSMHQNAGGGVAVSPTKGWEQLTARNKQLMAGALRTPVRQYTGAL